MDFSVFNLDFDDRGEIIEQDESEEEEEVLFDVCKNCGKSDICIGNNTESICVNCGLVFEQLGYSKLSGYFDGDQKSFYSEIKYKYNAFVYFKRKLKCLQGIQKPKRCSLLIKRLRSAGCFELEDIKRYFSRKKMYNRYIDVRHFYLAVNNIKSSDNPFLFAKHFVYDLSYYYKMFLNHYYSLSNRINKTKTLVVEFVCRNLSYNIYTYCEERNIHLPYDICEHVSCFKVMKSPKKKENYKEFSRTILEISFDNLYQKYTYDRLEE